MNKRTQEVSQIDEKLSSVGQQAIKGMVKSLPEDTLSMAWRSSLNEKLLEAAAKKRKKQRLVWVLRPALGLSLACALAVVVMFQPLGHKSMPVPDRGLESAIMSDHHNSVLLNEVSSAGLNANEVTSEVNPEDPDDGLWNDSDVQGL